METQKTSYNTAAPLPGKPVITRVGSEPTEETRPPVRKASELLSFMVGNVGNNRDSSFIDKSLEKENFVATTEGGAEAWGSTANPVSTTSSSQTTGQEAGEAAKDFTEDAIEENAKEDQVKAPAKKADEVKAQADEVDDIWGEFSFT